tara:strand:+ start:2227 stop:2601 length:375 start_codon:yes stop_codon:yes gene_type:complete
MEKYISESLGEYLNCKRMELRRNSNKDYTLKKIAKRCKISQAYLSEIELSGRANPGDNVLKALAEDLELNYWELAVFRFLSCYRRKMEIMDRQLEKLLQSVPESQRTALFKMIKEELNKKLTNP